MPRVKLKEQPTYEFTHTLTVRVTDLNYANHLSNDAVIRLVHEARVQLLNTLGCHELNLDGYKTGIIMVDLVVNFLQEGFLFDTLEIESHVGDIGRKSFRLYHRINKAGTPLALIETGFVAFNYTARKTVPIPDTFLQALNKIVPSS